MIFPVVASFFCRFKHVAMNVVEIYPISKRGGKRNSLNTLDSLFWSIAKILRSVSRLGSLSTPLVFLEGKETMSLMAERESRKM